MRLAAALPLLLAAYAAGPGDDALTATIHRDAWGAPHVLSDTDRGAVFGMAWALAEDDWPLIEENYLHALGRAAELRGEEEVQDDWMARALQIMPLSMREYESTTPRIRGLLDAFAAGMNEWLATGRRLFARHELPGRESGEPRIAHAEPRYYEAQFDALGRRPYGSNEWAVAPSRTAAGHARRHRGAGARGRRGALAGGAEHGRVHAGGVHGRPGLRLRGLRDAARPAGRGRRAAQRAAGVRGIRVAGSRHQLSDDIAANPGSRIMSRATLYHLALAFAVIGCGAGVPGTARGEWAGSIADSAGIRVVTNPLEALWDASESWRPVEDLEISDRTTPGLEFGEITDIDVDSRGRIVALDGMAKAYHVFGPDGVHLMTVGRPGAGPGELADPFQLLILPGDSVLVPDLGNARASVFAPDGSLARTFTVDFLDLAARRWGIAQDGSVIARRAESTADVLVRLGASGEVLDTVAHLESPFQAGAAEGRPTLLAPVPVWTALPAGGVAHGHSHSYRITVSDSQGATRLVFTLPVSPAAFSESQRDVVRAGLRATVMKQGVPEAAADQMLAQFAFWDALPVIADLLPGPEATYWVQRAAAPEAMQFDRLNMYRTDTFRGDAWDVFDADGRYLGEVRFPSGVRLLRIRDGLLYGVRLDELDVPSIVRFRLERGQADA